MLVNFCKRNLSSVSGILEYDIVVVGDGIVAAAFANGIKKSPITKHLSVALLHKVNSLPSQATETCHISNRTSAIVASNVHFLKKQELWTESLKCHSKVFSRLQITDAASTGHIAFNSSDSGMDYFGYIVENDRLHGTLFDSLKNSDAHLHRVSQPSDMKLSFDGYKRSLTVAIDGVAQTLSTRLLVGADGWQSHIRQLLDIKSSGWSYKQLGTAVTLDIAGLQQDTAYQRFLPSGPIALLPLGNNRWSLVWSIDVKYAETLGKLSLESFAKYAELACTSPMEELQELLDMLSGGEALVLQHLEKIIGSRMDRSFKCRVIDESVAFFPLQCNHSFHYSAPHAALIGDALRTIHPLAGQGLNLGLADVRALLSLLEQDVACGSEIGNPFTLNSYARQRMTHAVPLMAGVDGLKRIFSAKHLGIPAIRGAGMRLLDSSPFLKGLISKYALET